MEALFRDYFLHERQEPNERSCNCFTKYWLKRNDTDTTTLQGLYSTGKTDHRLQQAHLLRPVWHLRHGGQRQVSILEAITFALYGRTDRLNLSGDNRNYNMMNLKSEGDADRFHLRGGQRADTLPLHREGRRNSKRFGGETLDRTAYRKIDNEWIPIEQEALQKPSD